MSIRLLTPASIKASRIARRWRVKWARFVERHGGGDPLCLDGGLGEIGVQGIVAVELGDREFPD